MVLEPRSSRSLLQRRSSVSNAIQAGLDGIAVIGIAWYLIYDQFGYITSDYVIMLLLLVGALAVIYDCLLYTSPSPRDLSTSRMPSSA